MENEENRKERGKRYQLGYYLPLDSVEYFESNREYMRGASTLFLDCLEEAKYLAENPSPSRFEERGEELQDKFEDLQRKKEKGEEKNGEKFASTLYFEEKELSLEERVMLLVLFTKKGIGLSSSDPSVKGEVLIHLLTLITGAEPEEGRKCLLPKEKLLDERLIQGLHRERSPGSGRHISRKEVSVESFRYAIRERAIDRMMGHLAREDLDEVTKEKHPVHRELEGNKEDLIREVDSDVTMDDVVLPDELKRTIRSAVLGEEKRKKFFEEWNLKEVLENREGLNLLFSGPPGTGKTMMAKAIGDHLNKPVYMIEFSQLIDKYLGNTEKNSQAVFDLMEDKEGIVILDEADALLQSRSSASGSCDATENRMVNIFLKKMEDHSGLLILTSNLSSEMDKGVDRRIDLKIPFPEPDAEARKKIWEYHLPDEVPLGENVDIEELAKKFEFRGGQIRNSVVNAARMALLEDKEVIERSDFLNACEKEKSGEDAMDYSLEEEKKKERQGYVR